MYSLEELNNMDEQALLQIAQDLGMKKPGSSNREEVEYYILDHSASQTAKEEVARAMERNKPSRERKPRQKKAAPSADTATPGPASEATDQPQPKKRGRKPKIKTEEQPEIPLLTEAPLPAPESQSKPEAPEAAKEAEAPAPEVPQPKKRGRKPKARPEETAAETNAEAAPALSTDPAQEAKPEDTAAQQPIRQPRQRMQKQETGLGNFFGQSKGKTFTPRNQHTEAEPEAAQPVQPQPAPKAEQESEQQPQAQPQKLQAAQYMNQRPQQPLLIQEPAAQLKQQRQQQKQQRYNKRQQHQQRQAEYEFDGILISAGVLEIMPDNYGFLRSSDYNYLTSPDDIYVSQQQIKQYGLKTGDVVEAEIRPPREGEKYFPLCRILSVNGMSPEQVRDRVPFEHLVPLFPDQKFDITSGAYGNLSTRVVDMFAPIGKGQRALIVAPPKTGKTILLKDIANAISSNHPDTYIIMLLIDERPEEVTDMARSVNAEVIASTFDEPAERHVKIASLVLEKAKRLVECGHDVVIMLDSITRLARAYNTVSPASGKILSGGVDANALQRPKRFFGAARNIENGGSLTIIATALTETSSKMDEVIFEEFKGTGNMELQLDRKLSNKRIFPAVDIMASSTRRDDLLLSQEVLSRMWVLRNYLSDMNSVEAMDTIKKRMEMTRTNEELLLTMDK